MSVPTQYIEMSRLCVGCGICLGLCPTDAIKLKTTKGVLTVNFDYSRCSNCAMCIKACPALLNLYGRDLKIAEVLGRIHKIFFGYSTNHNHRYHGASGGIVTALAIYMLKHKLVDKVLVVKMKKFTIHALLTDSEYDVTSAQGSIYFKTFSLHLLQELLYHIRRGERICVVGLPCQISALKKLLRDFESKIYFIGLVCNHVNEIWYLEYIAKKYLPKNAIPVAIGPRKDGWPGKITIFFRFNEKSEESTIPPSKFWGSLPLLNISSPLGCMLCEDHLASMADIAVGDAWHPKFIGKDSLGVSILIIRTTKGLKLIEAAIRDGVVYAEETGFRDLIVTQGHQVIQGVRYAPLTRKLLQHRATVLRELIELDKLLIAILILVNRLASRFKVLRCFLATPLIERLLKITSLILYNLKWRHATSIACS